MSKEDFRRELNQTFDQMSGTPSPALRDRIRSTLGEAPPPRRPYWIAGVAAAVIAVLIVGVLWVNSPQRQSSSTPGAATSPSPSVTASTSASPSPSASPISNLPAFVCTSGTVASSGSVPPPVPAISALRTGSHDGYDRVTIEFATGVPNQAVELRVQGGTTFTTSPKGERVTLAGSKGILVVIKDADMHTSYSGSIDIVTGYATLAEVRRVEDYEGFVQLGLGVNGSGCYRAFWLTNPDRLVIDIQAAS